MKKRSDTRRLARHLLGHLPLVVYVALPVMPLLAVALSYIYRVG